MTHQFYNPFPSIISPLADQVHERTNQWVLEHQLFQSKKEQFKFGNVKCPYLTSRSFPYADIERLSTATKWIAWFFIYDDRRDETETGEDREQLAHKFTHLLSLLTTERNPDLIDPEDTLQVSLDQLWQETLTLAPSAWRDRFVRTIKESFDGFLWEADNRERKRTPSAEEYKKERIFSSSFYIGFDLVEFAENIDLPHEVFAHPILQKLRYYACSTACWSNDLFSYPKEIHHTDVHNLVFLIQDEENLSLDEAANRVLEIHNQDIRSFIEYEKQVPSFGGEIDNEVARYVQGLKISMRGHLDWMIEGTSRYDLQKIGEGE